MKKKPPIPHPETYPAFISLMQDRLNWCVENEYYEIASSLRDQIEYETTDNKEYKLQYYLKLWKRFGHEMPELYEEVKKKYKIID